MAGTREAVIYPLHLAKLLGTSPWAQGEPMRAIGDRPYGVVANTAMLHPAFAGYPHALLLLLFLHDHSVGSCRIFRAIGDRPYGVEGVRWGNTRPFKSHYYAKTPDIRWMPGVFGAEGGI